MLVTAAKILAGLIEEAQVREDDGVTVVVELPSRLVEEICAWGSRFEDVEPDDDFGDSIEPESQYQAA